MSITDFRLAQIATLTAQIEEKTKFLEEKVAELDAMEKIAGSMSEVTMRTLSQSASTSLAKRGTGDAVGIAEAAARNAKIIDDLKGAIAAARSELRTLNTEKQGLEEFTGRA